MLPPGGELDKDLLLPIMRHQKEEQVHHGLAKRMSIADDVIQPETEGIRRRRGRGKIRLYFITRSVVRMNKRVRPGIKLNLV